MKRRKVKSCVHCAAPSGELHDATCAFVVLAGWKRSDRRGRVEDSKPSVAIATDASIKAALASLEPELTALDAMKSALRRSGL